jgi:thiol-disulfide isomerase/thioredoxin
MLLVVAGCAPQAQPVATSIPAPSGGPTPAPKPTIVPLTGPTTRAAIEAHTGWEQLRAQDYMPDAAAVATIRERANDAEVLIILGTWCSDTKRELPRFFKIMDQAGVPESKVTLIGVDRSKKDAEGLTEKWQIQFVPTFIFVRDGRELGRIVETPNGTLEGNIAQVLQAQ